MVDCNAFKEISEVVNSEMKEGVLLVFFQYRAASLGRGYCIVFKPLGEKILVLAIVNRKTVYQKSERHVEKP